MFEERWKETNWITTVYQNQIALSSPCIYENSKACFNFLIFIFLENDSVSNKHLKTGLKLRRILSQNVTRSSRIF